VKNIKLKKEENTIPKIEIKEEINAIIGMNETIWYSIFSDKKMKKFIK